MRPIDQLLFSTLFYLICCHHLSEQTTIIDQDYGADGFTSIKSRFIPKFRVKKSAEQLNNVLPSTSGSISQQLVQTLTSSFASHYDAREISNFLESHPAHSIHDPRAYFTEERTSRSLAIMLNELNKLPIKLQFAFVVRVFNELGRKIATKLNYYSSEVVAILKKKTDDLGNKPDVNMITDAVNNAFESKEDRDIKEFDGSILQDNSISKLLAEDAEKSSVFNASLGEISQRFAQLITYFTLEANKTSLKIGEKSRIQFMTTILGESLQMGCWTMVKEMSSLDKFKIPDEVILFTDKILQTVLSIYQLNIGSKATSNRVLVGQSVKKQFLSANLKSFDSLNSISDKTGLIGPWNSYLFSNLGNSERVIKLFASLLQRVPLANKSRFINMYIAQVNLELERTLSGFVYMQMIPYNRNPSDQTLLNVDKSGNWSRKVHTSAAAAAATAPLKLSDDFGADKNKIPARCYLSGRRWRLILTRSMENYDRRDELFKRILGKISQLKFKLAGHGGNEIFRLCLPRLEVGLKGYSINGEPEVDGGASNKFPLRNPIAGLDSMNDPFSNGLELGYKLGVKVGFNEERNATLEMENSGKSGASDAKSKTMLDDDDDDNEPEKSSAKSREKKSSSLMRKYISVASYRKAASVAAKKAFEVALTEGYLTTLKVSMRAGYQLLTETASKMASLKSVNYGRLVGRETGRTVAENYLQEKKVDESERKSLIEVGENFGELAGKVMGQTIGSIVGAMAANEAYKRNIIRGGKLARAKFHLEEYEAGAKLAFEFGLKEGKKVGSSASLDPSAPNYLRFNEVNYSPNDGDGTGQEVDHWENEIIPSMSDKIKTELQLKRGHQMISGSMKGTYKISREIKKGFDRISYTNSTYDLDVFANGFIMNDVAYLTLNGTVNKLGILRGSLIAKDIFNEAADGDE